MRIWSVCLAVGLVVLGGTASQADAPDYYVGAGIRAGFNDSSAAVINAKAEITQWDELGISFRPTVVFADETEWRTAITAEGEILPNVAPFLGGGLSCNGDGLGQTEPIIVGGFDYSFSEQIVLQLGGNVRFRSNSSDTEIISG